MPFKFKQRTIKKIVLVLLVLFGGSKTYQTSLEGTPAGQEINGIVTRVSDGDTIVVNTVKIRIWGIDAPEKTEKGWTEAGDFLRREAFLKTVSCLVHTRDKYGRMVAQCTRASDDTDIGKISVRAGLAWDDMRYSKGYYKSEEMQAMADKIGLWR